MTPILADVVWPAIILEQRLLSVWPIGLGLLVEYLFVKKATTMTVRQSIVVDVIMNVISTSLGLILIPLAGLVWAFFPDYLLYTYFDIGTFNPGAWAATFVFAVLINAAVECCVIWFFAVGFKQEIDKKLFRWMCVANSLSVALAFGSLLIFPPEGGM